MATFTVHQDVDRLGKRLTLPFRLASTRFVATAVSVIGDLPGPTITDLVAVLVPAADADLAVLGPPGEIATIRLDPSIAVGLGLPPEVRGPGWPAAAFDSSVYRGVEAIALPGMVVVLAHSR